MHNTFNAIEVAHRVEAEASFNIYRQYLLQTIQTAERDGAKSLAGLLKEFFEQLVVPFDRIFIVHRDLEEARVKFFMETLPKVNDDIRSRSVQLATVNYLWLDQLQQSAFEQYLTGYAKQISKKLGKRCMNPEYIEEITKMFMQTLFNSIHTNLRSHALGAKLEAPSFI